VFSCNFFKSVNNDGADDDADSGGLGTVGLTVM
jgi:hypothetical protein